MFTTAVRTKSKLRLCLSGPSGSGKTFTALSIASALGKRIALIDTEAGSASKYAEGKPFHFDNCVLTSFHPQKYIDAIRAAEDGGYDVIVIDSMTHAWDSKDGALELVNNATKRSQSANSYTAWRDVTPLHNSLVEAIIQSSCHVIATLRVKTEYVLEANEKGRQVPRKVGLAPIQRAGLEYEFDVVGDVNLDHDLVISKTRCSDLDGKVFNRAGKDVANILLNWLNDGSAPELVTQQPTRALPSTEVEEAAVAQEFVDDFDKALAEAPTINAEVAAMTDLDRYNVLALQTDNCKIPRPYLNSFLKKKWPDITDPGTPEMTGLTDDRMFAANELVDQIYNNIKAKLGKNEYRASELTKAVLTEAFQAVLV